MGIELKVLDMGQSSSPWALRHASRCVHLCCMDRAEMWKVALDINGHSGSLYASSSSLATLGDDGSGREREGCVF